MDKKGFNCKIIGKNVKEKRLKEHFTQAQLAEMADISVVHLSHIENGTVNMSLKILHTFCNIFFCTPNDILLSSGYQNKNSSSFFLEYGLNPEDQRLLEDFSKVLRKRHMDESDNGNNQEQDKD